MSGTDLLETLEALRNECSGRPRPHMLIPLLERADRVIAAARKSQENPNGIQ